MSLRLGLAFAALVLAAPILALSWVEAASGPVRVEIGIHYSRFQPDAITVPSGRPISFVIRNDDPIDHEWIVGDEAVHQRHRTGTEPHHGERSTEVSIDPLSVVETTVTFDRPGVLRFICHLPGHETYGMVGVITIS